MRTRGKWTWRFVTSVLALAAPMAGHATELASKEGAALSVDSADQACLQLKDANTWSSHLGYLSGVGTVTPLASLLTELSETAVALTSSTHPPVVGYRNGIRWSDADMATLDWTPQGLTTGSSGATNFAIVSWHSADGDHSRVSIVDTTDLSRAKYRNVVLVTPTAKGKYEPVGLHVGGLALEGNYLYVADSHHGFQVFDLNQIRKVNGSNSTCSGRYGYYSSTWCANGYAYMLPQVSAYTIPSTRSNGATIPTSCKPKFSWAGKDTRSSTDLVLSGEYCAPPVDGNTDAENEDRECGNDVTGLNGRLYQWPIGSDHKLVTSGLYVTPKKVFYMNERNVQGIAPDLTQDAAGNYEADTYWLASTKASGALFKVSPSAPAKEWKYANAEMPYAPEGLHASSSGNLWIVTEGQRGNTNPATGGRVYISVEQSSVH